MGLDHRLDAKYLEPSSLSMVSILLWRHEVYLHVKLLHLQYHDYNVSIFWFVHGASAPRVEENQPQTFLLGLEHNNK